MRTTQQEMKGNNPKKKKMRGKNNWEQKTTSMETEGFKPPIPLLF